VEHGAGKDENRKRYLLLVIRYLLEALRKRIKKEGEKSFLTGRKWCDNLIFGVWTSFHRPNIPIF